MRLEEHMDVQAICMQIARIHRDLGVAHQMLSAKMEQLAKEEREGKRQTKGR